MARYFEYQNPIYSDAFEYIRDAQITNVGDKYYLTGTLSSYHWPEYRPQKGVHLFVSDDLKNWKHAADLVRREDIPDDAWYKDYFWAPEIHCKNDRFYLSFTAKNVSYKKPFGMCLAVAEQIEGPYQLLNTDQPLIGGIDLSMLTDDDGKTYGFYTSGGVKMVELDLDAGKLLSEPVLCVDKVPGTWEDRVIEGPYCMKRNGTYYLFYSCGARGYEVGYATAENIRGPWQKYEGNPIFGAQNQEACEKMGIEFTGDPESPILFAGHNAVFTGPDGRDWVSYLIQEKGKPEQMGIDPIWIEDGAVKTEAPTYTPQKIELPK